MEAELHHLARLSTLGELSASIAHELSQPLSAIATNGEASLRWLDQPEPAVERARASVTAIVNNAQRAGEIVRKLRTLSRKTGIDKEELALNDIVAEVLPLIEAPARVNGIALHLDLAEPSPRVLGDSVQLQQVLLNLLMNGIQAMAAVQDGPRLLAIGSRCQAGEACIAVRDTGMGLDPGTAERLFEPFFTTRSDGLGLGLSISRSIMEAHDGRIWAAGNAGPGATFLFALPVAP